MATFNLNSAAGGGIRTGIYPITTTATSLVPGAGASDIYLDVFSNNQNASGVGTVVVQLNVLSTAVVTVYTTSAPLSNIQAGTALWTAVSGLSAVTGLAASVASQAVITGPITAISYTVTTALAGNQATISINAGYAAGRPASY